MARPAGPEHHRSYNQRPHTHRRAATHTRREQVTGNESGNKETVRRLYEEVGNQGRLELIDEIAVPDHVEHNPFPQQSQGAEGLKQRISMIRAAFNPRFTIEHLIAEGDKVAVMWSNRGTHVGDWFGFPATGKEINTRGADIHLLRDGRLAEHWDVVDLLDFLTKVGVLQAPPAAASGRR
jgi:predicted ester cyclase